MSRPAKEWRSWPVATLEVEDAPNIKSIYYPDKVIEINDYLRYKVWGLYRHLAYTTIWSRYQQRSLGKVTVKYHFCIHPEFESHLTYLALKYGLKIEDSFDKRGIRVNRYNIVMGKKRAWDP